MHPDDVEGWRGEIRDGEPQMNIKVVVSVTSLCPCSKEISQYGAHNQRCEIEASVRFTGTMWIEDLVELLEAAASSPVYSVLKRPDEKYVTEKAFENPKFVEDIVRDLALSVENDPRVTWYSINSENFESIHNHNAYAQITLTALQYPGITRVKFQVDGEAVSLPLKEFELLEMLLRNAGRVLTRGQLIDRVWGSDYVGDTKTLDVHVKRLRAKVEPNPSKPQHIVTVRGLGYKFEAAG